MNWVTASRFHRAPEVCRTRLELLCALDPDVPTYGLGERIGLADGYDRSDTGFHSWTDDGRRYFNGLGEEIPPDRIAAELADPNGRRAFHPVREPVLDAVLDRVA